MTEPAIDPAKDQVVVHELADAVRPLFDRHLANSKVWYPFEDVPFDEARTFEPGQPFDPEHYPLSPGVQAAIVVNLLTEDNLPYYTHTIMSQVSEDHPLTEWTRRWTAEEFRHGAAIRDWVLATRAVDPYRLEDDRMAQMSKGEVPEPDSFVDMISYVSFQELATQVAHRNTAQALDKAHRGKKVMSKVAGDEGLHHAFYRDLVSAALEIDASTTVVAIQRQLRNFKMPGTGIPNFAELEVLIALEGIFDAEQFCEAVVKPTLAAWTLEDLTGLTPEAERARDKIARNVSVLERVANVHRNRLAELVGAGATA